MPPPVKAPAKKVQPTVKRDDDDNGNDDLTAESPEQAELLAAGARPTHVDVDSLHAQIQRMQAQLDQMNAQQVDTSDPVGASLVNLSAHLQAHCDANPVLASKPSTLALRDAVSGLRENTGNLSADDAAELRIVVDEFAEENPGVDLSYVRRLARDLHKETLSGKDKSKKTEKK